MCEFVSWIEHKNEILFLTRKELETSRGQELKKYLGEQFDNDVKGHGAIEWYYKLKPNSGQHKECTDFSSPDNFPEQIVSAIKKGLFQGIGISLDMLNKKALAEYEKIEGQAWAEYKKIEGQALAEYEKINGQAWAEYEKIEGQALAEYKKINGQALAEYKKINGQALAEYEKIEGPALAEYKKIEGPAFWKIAKQKNNRTQAWR